MKTVNSFTGSILASHIEASKDTFYRLKNNQGILWRMILWLFSLKFIKLAEKNGEKDSTAVRCFLFDDSTLAKTGRNNEKVSRVWDHVLNRCILGYKLLVMGYWDGILFIPLDFSLHREKGKNADKPFGFKEWQEIPALLAQG